MADLIDDKIKNYKTAPFDARFPNTNQTRNCFQNYLGEDMMEVHMCNRMVYVGFSRRWNMVCGSELFSNTVKASVYICVVYKNLFMRVLFPKGFSF